MKPKNWRPERNQKYYFIYMARDFYVHHSYNDWFDVDLKTFSINNCFRTKKEAQQAIKKIKQVLRGESYET